MLKKLPTNTSGHASTAVVATMIACLQNLESQPASFRSAFAEVEARISNFALLHPDCVEQLSDLATRALIAGTLLTLMN